MVNSNITKRIVKIGPILGLIGSLLLLIAGFGGFSLQSNIEEALSSFKEADVEGREDGQEAKDDDDAGGGNQIEKRGVSFQPMPFPGRRRLPGC